MGDDRAEGLSAIGDGGRVTTSLMPDVDGIGSGSLPEGDECSHFFFPFIFISWRLITLQYCSGFCHTFT